MAKTTKRDRPARVPLVQVHAHRGGAALAPENTLAAFRRAVSMGAHYLELDVRCCATGELVVVHDSTLQRVAGRPEKVADLSLSELLSVDVGSHFHADYKGESIPTLAHVVEELDPGVRFNIEIKEEQLAGDGSALELGRLITAMALSGRCIVSSFNPGSLRRIASQCCVPMGLLYPTEGQGAVIDRLSRRPWPATLLPVYALHPREDLVDAALVRRAQLRGLAVNTWTVNEPQRMRQLMELGVNGLITDRPDLALEILAELDPVQA